LALARLWQADGAPAVAAAEAAVNDATTSLEQTEERMKAVAGADASSAAAGRPQCDTVGCAMILPATFFSDPSLYATYDYHICIRMHADAAHIVQILRDPRA
jgi:hypothetical protein